MTSLFLNIINMSLTASYCIIFVCIARLLLKKAPRYFSYLLWIVVAFRLICPISFESNFSLIDDTFMPNITYETVAHTEAAITPIETYTAVTSELPDEDNSYEQIIAGNNQLNDLSQASETEKVAAVFWIIVFGFLSGYNLFTYIRLHQKLKLYAKRAFRYKSIDVWHVNGLNTPFVFGFFKAAIYMPEGLSDRDNIHCLAHEYTHIRRKDYLIKQIAFFLVCVHWFNPLVWLSFYLMTKDMEISCDEAALKSIGLEDRKAYSSTLLELSSTSKYYSGCPITFGTNSTKSRIKHIMNYKRPSFWILLLAIILVVICLLGLSANPKTEYEPGKVTQESSSNTVIEKPIIEENQQLPEKDNLIIQNISGDAIAKEERVEQTLLEYLEDKIEKTDAEREEIEQRKNVLSENILSLRETLQLENLSTDKIMDFNEQLKQSELEFIDLEVQLNVLELKKGELEAQKDLVTQLIIQAQSPEILEKFTDYINQPENNAFVTTIYRGEKVNLAMLLYDIGGVLGNVPFKDAEMQKLNRENINEKEILYRYSCHFTGEQISTYLQEKMNRSLKEIKYTEEFPNNLKDEWIYLEEFDTYTMPMKGDSKVQEFVCKEITVSYDGKLIIAYEAKEKNGWIKSGRLEMIPKAPNNQSLEPDDYYFFANVFTEGGYTDDVISN